MNTFILVLSLLFTLCSPQKLIVSFPQQLGNSFKNSSITVTSSPIGFKPKSGTLHGKLLLASPLNACSQISQVSYSEDEDVFVMADDAGCLESVKAHNIAGSGAFIGIIKKNINNTLHDRQIDLVHIPILEIEPSDFNILYNYLSKPDNNDVSLLADFNSKTESQKIVMEFWLSPTKAEAYSYILQFKNFLKNQQQYISFHPRFALHSQSATKQYIGCYSSGKYCPPELEYEGRPEGANIVGQALRQIIVADRNIHKWFDYANYYLYKCLLKSNDNLWVNSNSQMCSESAMRTQNIDSQQIFTESKNSFQGSRPEVDGNFYLQEQRQLYISQKITKFPILLLNGKQYSLDSTEQMKLRICSMMHPNPNQQTDQCQKLTNPPLFSSAEIFVGIGILIAVMVTILFACKIFIQKKMKKEMKGEVDKTLSQYYRYMETLEEPDPSASGKVPLMEQKIETTQIGSVELTEIKNRQIKK